jgi:hypothetical protein
MYKCTRFWRSWICLLILPLALMIVSCGSSQGTVSGKVSYKGQPVRGGTVSIFPAKGGFKQAQIQEDGSYIITKVPVGQATLTVETESAKPSSTMPMQAQGAAGYYAKMPKLEAPPGADPSQAMPAAVRQEQKDPKRYVPIPDKYRDPQKSGLSLTVKGGKNPFDIDLQ